MRQCLSEKFSEQAAQALENVKAVVEAEGLTMEHVLSGNVASALRRMLRQPAGHKTNGFIACRLFTTVAQRAQQARKAGLRPGLN